ncbi:uncharacterized protein LY89DRAFT_507703 [Mollisia scopiformis]|uniref:Ubiquitin-like domain-containing protein n=1 Tax=Mollisia scopiformis TaxID=149040 RepID=A0A194XFK2_MOLSC|nr:uncharacterized protein LY89DRAFT_507703 [Mollisia scopiformis]KUJ18914.1 hypothetical protein LY89DRAFT_507703 [Mollisia scopiformis]
MKLWPLDGAASKWRNWFLNKSTRLPIPPEDANQPKKEGEFHVFLKWYGYRSPYLVNPKTTCRELKIIANKRSWVNFPDFMYIFNHEDRKPVPDEAVLFERGVREGSVLEVLYPIWRDKPKIDENLIMATIKSQISPWRLG